ncbi:MAG: LysR family transcriptional regulator [Cellulosilyticaceae bacterium]
MELRVLRYFLAIAKAETISGAAELLHLSQPTLSRQLMEMEDALGTQLFIRGNRKLTLTEEGVFLQKRAQEILSLVDKTEAAFHTTEEIISGDIMIGCGETDAMRLIIKVAQDLQQMHPHIRYRIFSGNADDVMDKLDKGLLDFGVVIEPIDITKYDFVRLPAKDTWGVLMPKESPLATKNFIEASDLLNLPLIISTQTLVDHELSRWFGKDLGDLNIVSTYNLIFNASLLVEQGMGYALCLDKLINTTGDSAFCFRPLHPPLEAHLDIIWKKYQVFSKGSQKFLSMIKTAFTQ